MTRMLLQLWDSVCHGGMTVWDRVSLCYMSVIFMSYVKRMNDPWQDTLEFASLSARDEYGRGVMEWKSICICATIKNGVTGLDMR